MNKLSWLRLTPVVNKNPQPHTVLQYGHFGDPNTTRFISQLLKGLSSSVIYHWKGKYLSNMHVNSFLHNIIYTIMINSVKLSVYYEDHNWRVLYWHDLFKTVDLFSEMCLKGQFTNFTCWF